MRSDMDDVLGALRRQEMRLACDRGSVELPAWVDWLVWLGQWMRFQAQSEGRRIAIVRLPTRRLAAAFAALGAVVSAARVHEDSLDWAALRQLPSGTRLYWREPSGGELISRSGRLLGMRSIGESELLEIDVATAPKARQASRSLSKSAVASYRVTLGAVSAKSDLRMTAAELLLHELVIDMSPGWMRSPSVECSIVTERSSFMRDIDRVCLSSQDGTVAPLVDVLAIVEAGGHNHGKSRIVSARRDGMMDEAGSVTVLDGAAAASRLVDSAARSVIVLLDHSEYDEEVDQMLATLRDFSDEKHVRFPSAGPMAVPLSISALVFGLSDAAKPRVG